jgi:phosphoketolase
MKPLHATSTSTAPIWPLRFFKSYPEGHTGGALNMVPADAGHMAISAITEQTRAWMMGQTIASPSSVPSIC